VRDAAAHEMVVCTLKDAVKLAPHWPRVAPALWYVSQSVSFEAGELELDRVLRHLLDSRPTPST
jgi:tetraacyldisaccharide 4'-kinase